MKTAHKILAVAGAAVAGVVLVAAAAGSGGTNLQAKSVWIYPYANGQVGYFQNVTILEKTPTSLKFKSNEKVVEHCGNYTVEN